MPRATLPLLLLLAALLLPAAQAQQTQPILTVILEAPEAPLEPGGRAVYKGIAHFASEPTAYADTNGIAVEFTIAQQPTWASVVLSPSHHVILPSFTGHTVSGHVPFEFVVDVAPTVTDVTGIVEIQAVTAPDTLFRSATASGATPISVQGALPSCTEDAPLATQAADAPRLSVPAATGVLPLAAALAAAAVVAHARRGRAFSPIAGLVLAAAVVGGVGLAAAPVAEAQAHQPTLVLAARQPAEAVAPGTHLTVPAIALYVSGTFAAATTSGVPVEFAVAEAPEWANVVIQGASGAFQPRSVTPNGATMDQMLLSVDVVLSSDAPPGAIAGIVLKGVTSPSAASGGAVASTVIALKVAGTACAGEDAVQAPAAEPMAAGGARR